MYEFSFGLGKILWKEKPDCYQTDLCPLLAFKSHYFSQNYVCLSDIFPGTPLFYNYNIFEAIMHLSVILHLSFSGTTTVLYMTD